MMTLKSNGILADFLFNGKFSFTRYRTGNTIDACDLFGDFISQLSFTTLMFLTLIFCSWAAIFSAAVWIDMATIQGMVYNFYMDVRHYETVSAFFWMMSMVVGTVVWPILAILALFRLLIPVIKRFWLGVRDSVCFEVEIK